MKQALTPTLDDLREEFVLMQAWKKTSSYLRQHSWYSDTLEVDYQSLRIPVFLREIQERLRTPEAWAPAPLEFVPAPKGQSWHLRDEKWTPRSGENIRKKIRPLAHVALQDQVVATALLLCLADTVERHLGDPLTSIDQAADRRKVLAYGHRLFCDSSDGVLQHRWGSSKLYRLYYRDYRTFLRRPEVTAEHVKSDAQGCDVAIVHSDLSKFYDRVRPELLHDKVAPLLPDPASATFLDFVRRVFNWSWRDRGRASEYAALHDIPRFESIALPQGLVASGFFANVALNDVDGALRAALGTTIDEAGHLLLKDVCYYVDDLRLVLQINQKLEEKEIEIIVRNWLQGLLNQHAPGLLVEESKTKATVIGRPKRYLVPQSKTATRIQRDVSGVLDMLHGTELIGAIEGFFHTQKRYSSDPTSKDEHGSGLLVGISDMRDDTAARFAAGRFRRTFRSLRPLLNDEVQAGTDSDSDEIETLPTRLVLSRQQLDERGRFFAAMLIDEWVANPGNVRLLRIALDLYPDKEFLDKVLRLLRPGWDPDGGSRGPQREVQQYCLAELFRAAATETGMVSDDECLPAGVEVAAYHARLTKEGQELLQARIASPAAPKRFPWYLLQQVLLYLTAQNKLPEVIAAGAKGLGRGLNLYRRFAQFLGSKAPLDLNDRAIYLILATSAFGLPDVLDRFLGRSVSPTFLRRIAELSPATARMLWNQLGAAPTNGQSQVARVTGLTTDTRSGETTLAHIVLHERNPFWQESNLLRLALELLTQPEDAWPSTLTPWQIECEVVDPNAARFGELMANSVKITSAVGRSSNLFDVPAWCETPDERRRFQLGLILRFALRGSVDFLSTTRPGQRRLPRYSAPASHWERQKYSTFQGRSAFGPAWIPLSSWTEDFLFDLLRWPGAGIATVCLPLSEWIERLKQRLNHLKSERGDATRLPFLEQLATWPGPEPKEWKRPLRVGVVQSVVPDMDDYKRHGTDPQLLSDPGFRLKQRRHLSSVLEAVIQMLAVRETHKLRAGADGRLLDVLVFPELAIHPLDIKPLILPFVRTHKCMVLFGQVYHPVDDASGPLINSCTWAIPEWRPTSGFQVRMVEQGKEHLTSDEKGLTPQPASFRPAQWIVEYRWTSAHGAPPLRLSASVCYDSTDLALASDLRSRNDLYFVCALNRDVGTFDRMAEGLHYHMYQGVIIVNNGQFGGSNFYMPFREAHERQVFHFHGQPQANIAFAEITPQELIDRPRSGEPSRRDAEPKSKWKTPPAAWTSFGIGLKTP